VSSPPEAPEIPPMGVGGYCKRDYQPARGLRRKYHRRESAVQARPTKLKVRDYKHIAPTGQHPRFAARAPHATKAATRRQAEIRRTPEAPPFR